MIERPGVAPPPNGQFLEVTFTAGKDQETFPPLDVSLLATLYHEGHEEILIRCRHDKFTLIYHFHGSSCASTCYLAVNRMCHSIN